MKQEKLYFYEVSDEFIEYLSQYDKKIMYSKVETRKFKRKYIGILLRVNDLNYIAPLSSFKEKHNGMKDGIDFIKIGNKSVINLNNMFPVLLEEITKVIIEEERDVNYKQLLRDEYNICIPKFKKILRNARVLYNQVVKYKMPIRKRCCDFRKLELKCVEYKIIVR